MPTKPINQYAISRILGSRVEPIRTPRFGGFGVLGAAAEFLRTRHTEGKLHPVTPEVDALIARAFEDMRNGYTPGHILWDKAFAKAFVQECQKLKLDLPPAVLKRRLINIRKNPARYRRIGVEISKATKREQHVGPIGKDAHAIEFSLVRLKYKYGCSIDDVLLEPLLSREFEKVACAIGTDLSPERARLGALYLRKSWFCGKKGVAQFEGMDLPILEEAMTPPQVAAGLHTSDVPDVPGILELIEGSRYLFVSGDVSLRLSLSPFIDGTALAAMADRFWKPDPDMIATRYFAGTEFNGISIRKWQIKLIHDRKPVFNWPVADHAA